MAGSLTTYNFRPGVDLPDWTWLATFPGTPAAFSNSYPGGAQVYDGARYLYWATQVGSASAASTIYLWRFDTRTNAWALLGTSPVSGFNGVDVEYDTVRNVLYMTIGNATTTIYCFNLNAAPVTIANVACAANAFTAIPVLPATANAGATIEMPNTSGLITPAGATIAQDTGIAAAGSTATSIVDNPTTKPDGAASYTIGHVGCQVRFTSGALAGQRRIITAVPSPATLTTNAFGGAPAAGDTFVVEAPTGTVTTGGSATTITDANLGAVVNQYGNASCDVLMTSGAAAGQRRRLASNTATVLTLSAAVTGNGNTGPLANAPAAGDTYVIVPSQDYLYFNPGNGTAVGVYRLDVVQTVGAAWTAVQAAPPATIGPGSNILYGGSAAPFSLVVARGAGTATVYYYDLGLNSWRTQTMSLFGETLTTGAGVTLWPARRRLLAHISGSTRVVSWDLAAGVQEAFATVPYALPPAYDGKRARVISTAAGVTFLYLLRPGGQEFWRIPIEWLGP